MKATIRIVPVKGDKYVQVITRQRALYENDSIKVLRSFGNADTQENLLRAYLFKAVYNEAREVIAALDKKEALSRSALFVTFGAILGEEVIVRMVEELAPRS